VKNICGVMGRLPAEIWAMTPADTDFLCEAWNAEQGDQGPAAPTDDEYEALLAAHG